MAAAQILEKGSHPYVHLHDLLKLNLTTAQSELRISKRYMVDFLCLREHVDKTINELETYFSISIAISSYHKPNQTDERQHIEYADGFVMYRMSWWRPSCIPCF
ncbi:putative protein phosphatase 2C 45 [Platanthera zijinensis]|uniref:Uncharacterized protein n=1 Tax=Platanthera zijinensis TaxID=2320716 RepID=A0AAP0B3Z9_9ASPA